MQTLDAFLSSLTLGAPQAAGDLTMWPLLRQPAGAPWYDTLGQAVSAGTARVTEISESGSVPELRVVNDGRRPVIIVDGEELTGAKQNRIVNLTIVVPAKTTVTVPVSCVEAGRWRAVSREFMPADNAFHAAGRRAKVDQVTSALRESGAARADQGAIWQEIDVKAARLGVQSDTRAASAMFDGYRARLDQLLSGLRAVDLQVGAVFAIRGRIAGLDAFDCEETWRQLMPKLVRSYGLDALDRGIAGDGSAQPDPRSFLDAIARATRTTHRAVGAGHDLRLAGPGITGAALSTDAGIVHLTAFAK